MHSLRASVVFIAIAVFAFLSDNRSDNRRLSDWVEPQQKRLVPAKVAAEEPAYQEPHPLVAQRQKPSQTRPTKVTRVVRATAYNAVPEQTDSTPEICAWGDRVKPGIIAISRDLERIGLTRGKKVHIQGIGNVVVMDRMHRRKRNQIDLYMERYEDAVRFGVKELTISWTEEAHAEQES